MWVKSVSVYVCVHLSACGSVSLKKKNLLYDLFWSYILIRVLPLPISIDSPRI